MSAPSVEGIRRGAAAPAERASGRRRIPWGRLAAAAIAILLLIPNSSVLEHRAIVVVFLGALVLGRGGEFVRDWLPLVASATLFVLLRQFAAYSPMPHQGAAFARLDAGLFGGTAPTAWLQQRLYVPGRAGMLDYAATAVHASYFFGFVLVGIGIWFASREQFRQYTRLLAVTFALGLAGYFLLPAEPPWLAARQGAAAPVQRIIGETARGTRLTAGVVAAGTAWQSDPDALGDPNPAAAMPSVHTAITVALALFLARRHPLLGALGALYAIAMGFSLVYLGEHYVVDLIAGAACAALAAWITLRSAPPPGRGGGPRSGQPQRGSEDHTTDVRTRKRVAPAASLP